MNRIAVLEVGGTHATGSWVNADGWRVLPSSFVRCPVRADGSATQILDALAGCLRQLGDLADRTVGVAIPGPFDYPNGIGQFRDVGKFDALCGVDVRAGLIARLPAPPRDVVFVNDAGGFGLGEWLTGPARGTSRAVAITLGTGVGSAFVAEGELVSSGPNVPPCGYVYRLIIDGRPLESVVSRRAIRARYAVAADIELDVREIAERAAGGDPVAYRAFTEPLRSLGTALAPWLDRFDAEVLVVGGAMSRSWPLVEDALRHGLSSNLPIKKSRSTEVATTVGTAWHAERVAGATAKGRGEQ